MRWFIPNNNAFPNALLAAWNASVVTMLGGHAKTSAGRRHGHSPRFLRADGHARVWQNSFSDDFSLTIAIERTGRRTFFFPNALLRPTFRPTFSSLLEFTNRQIKITRIYRPKMWVSAFATHFLFCFTLLLGLDVAFNLAIESRPSSQVITLFVFPLLLAAVRGALR